MARYKPYIPSAALKQILAGKRVRGAVKLKGRAIATKYRAIAPKRTGQLARSVQVTTTRARAPVGRWTGVVSVTARHAAAQEFGNARTRGGHYLKRAAGR